MFDLDTHVSKPPERKTELRPWAQSEVSRIPQETLPIHPTACVHLPVPWLQDGSGAIDMNELQSAFRLLGERSKYSS